MAALFSPGHVVATPSALAAMTPEEPLILLSRHVSGDWGEVDAHDRRANDRALKDGTRALSAYTLPNGRKVWILTEADRSATTVLIPEEY